MTNDSESSPGHQTSLDDHGVTNNKSTVSRILLIISFSYLLKLYYCKQSSCKKRSIEVF